MLRNENIIIRKVISFHNSPEVSSNLGKFLELPQNKKSFTQGYVCGNLLKIWKLFLKWSPLKIHPACCRVKTNKCLPPVVCLTADSELFLFSPSSLTTTHIPGLPARLTPDSSIQADHLHCSVEGEEERGRVHVVLMTESSVLHCSGQLDRPGAWTWTSDKHSLDLRRVSQLSVAAQHNKGWQVAGLVSQGNNTEIFLLTRDSGMTLTLPGKTKDDLPILSCKLDCSGSLVCLATQNKLYILRQGSFRKDQLTYILLDFPQCHYWRCSGQSWGEPAVWGPVVL